MAVKITDTIVQTDTREEGVREVYALQDKGHAATLYGPVNGTFYVFDLDAPLSDVVAAMATVWDDATYAAEEALRIVKRGY